MPSLMDGMAICVTGHAATDDTEHNQAHFADAAIENAAIGSDSEHTATVATVTNISIAAMSAVRPDCRQEIAEAVLDQFEAIDQNQLLRAKRLPPLPTETIGALSTGATRPL